MLIGKLVKDHIVKLFEHCEYQDRDELFNLMNKEYSKEKFNINFPFCKEINLINNEDYKRFWKEKYQVRNKKLRVCSQWVVNSKDLFLDYLLLKNIITSNEFAHFQEIVQKKSKTRKIISHSKNSIKEKEIALRKNSVEKFYSQISSKLKDEAQMMSEHYEHFYSLEKSIRNLIVENMMKEFGENWWNNNVDPEIQNNVNYKIKYELGSILTKQSDHNIDYTTFGELRKIILSNWKIFSVLFNKDKSTFNRIMTDLNKLRNPIAHCTPFIDKEITRLNLTIDDWFELLK